MSSPEVARVYVGSFWQEPLVTMDNAELFEDEERDLMRDLAILPRQSAVRKINEVSLTCDIFAAVLSCIALSCSLCDIWYFLPVLQLVKRIRKVKALAYIIGHLKSQMPTLMGKEKKQQKLITNMPNVFRTVMKKYNLAPGDFPVSRVASLLASVWLCCVLLTLFVQSTVGYHFFLR